MRFVSPRQIGSQTNPNSGRMNNKIPAEFINQVRNSTNPTYDLQELDSNPPTK